MSKHLLSKSTFIRGQQCQKSLYLHQNRPFLRDKLSPEQLAKFRRGTDIGVLARSLFPGGKDMTPRSPSQLQKMREETSKALHDATINILYEAVFQYDDVLIMLDILVREGQTWHAYEVKSSRSISETYLKDAALQNYVIEGCGVQLSDFTLIYVDEDYVVGDQLEIEGFFKMRSVLEIISTMKEKIRNQVAVSKETLKLTSSPNIEIGIHCLNPYICDFKGHCWKSINEKSVLQLKSIPIEKRFELYANGIRMMDQLPDSVKSNTETNIEIAAYASAELRWDQNKLDEIRKKLQLHHNHLTYFKLIATESAVPVLKNTKPYTPLPLVFAFQPHATKAGNLIFIQQNEESLQSFFLLLKSLLDQNHLLVTDHAFPVLSALKQLAACFPAAQQISVSIQDKIVGISELSAECKLYYPSPGDAFNLSLFAEISGGKKLNLTNELYIIRDINAADDPSQLHPIDGKLQQYLQAISISFDFFVG